MKIIFASKFYYRRGGLEAYLFKTKELLEKKGNSVIPFSTNYFENIESGYEQYFCRYHDLSKIKKTDIKLNISVFKNMFDNPEAYECVKKLCANEKPQILQGFGVTKHLSPSIFKSAKDNGLKTIMRLSDYALMCPNSSALDGRGLVCSDFDCVTKNNLKCISLKCVQGSTIASVVGYLEVKINNVLGNYKRYIDHWIAPSEFIRNVFIRYYGIESCKITYLPIFFDSGNIEPWYGNKNYILYAGRIDREKGVLSLLSAVAGLGNVPLKIIGTGLLEDEVKNVIKSRGINAEFLGFQKFEVLKEYIKNAMFLVVPSEWNENSPNIILESFACGKPVIGSRIGGIPEMVVDGKTGYTFESGNVEDLKEKIQKLADDPKKMIEMGKQARERVERQWNAEEHYKNLISIYESVMK